MRQPPRTRRQRGAALLTAMLTVTLVATLAAAAMWQQWRAIEVETSERARVQSAWILLGALDWSRLILREDSLARNSDGTDNLTEPWSIPLEEARLSSFLVADRKVGQSQDSSTDTADAFLSGQIIDLQSRLNLRNLIVNNQVDPSTLKQFTRLFGYLGLPVQQLAAVSQMMLRAQTSAAESGTAPLMPQTLAQLSWWGLRPATIQALTPYATLLPVATRVNLNTASAVVLWASIDGLDMSGAQSLVQTRNAHHFRSESDASNALGSAASLSAGTHAVSSQYFEVRGRLRLGSVVVEERSLVYKQRGGARTLWRERGSFLQEPPVQQR